LHLAQPDPYAVVRFSPQRQCRGRPPGKRVARRVSRWCGCPTRRSVSLSRWKRAVLRIIAWAHRWPLSHDLSGHRRGLLRHDRRSNQQTRRRPVRARRTLCFIVRDHNGQALAPRSARPPPSSAASPPRAVPVRPRNTRRRTSPSRRSCCASPISSCGAVWHQWRSGGGGDGGDCAHRCPASDARYCWRAFSASISVPAAPLASMAKNTGQTTTPTQRRRSARPSRCSL
jgi:hypothetical protein